MKKMISVLLLGLMLAGCSCHNHDTTGKMHREYGGK